jgi:hypothetical protein
MKKSLVFAALATTAAATSGTKAALVVLEGSDTLLYVTQSAITSCGSACTSTLNYIGTGSSNGEAQMVDKIAGSGASYAGQGISPMTSFLDTTLCTGVSSAHQQTATGIVIGLDGLAIFASTSSTGVDSCGGTAAGCAPETTAGLAYSTAVSTGLNSTTQAGALPWTNANASYTYTFTNWKDVLAVVYGGISHTTSSGFNPAASDSGCNSDIRHALVNNWGSLFQNPSGCDAQTNKSGDGCVILQHAFRRDDTTGQAELFAKLVGLSPTPNAEANYYFGASPFCNVNEAGVKSTSNNATTGLITITTSVPHGLSTGAKVTVVGVGVDVNSNPVTNGNVAADGTWIVTKTTATAFTLNGSNGNVTGNGTVVGSYAMVLLPPPAGLLGADNRPGAPLPANTNGSDFIPTSYREMDVIRRPCAGTTTVPLEDVCNRDGNLGVVIPINATDSLSGLTTPAAGGTTVQFPQTLCAASSFTVSQPAYVDPNQGIGAPGNCPNGDAPHGGNQCVIPTAGGVGASCFSNGSTAPFVFNNSNISNPSPKGADGRVFNSHLFGNNNSYALDPNGNNIVGAWYRLHQVDVIANESTAQPCLQHNVTQQIGCLAQASPCSIGFDGRTVDQWDTGLPGAPSIIAQKLAGIGDALTCVQTFVYPFSRKLYLDTIAGFTNATYTTAGEMALADFEGQPQSPAGTLTGIQNILSTDGFINFATGTAPNNGSPFQEDFDEPLICPTQNSTSGVANANVVAYQAAAYTGSPLPNVGTVCGNGVKEIYEDCDDGTPTSTTTTYPTINGGDGNAVCSTLCRWSIQPPPVDPGTDTVFSVPCGTGSSVTGDACTSTTITNLALSGITQGRCYQIGSPAAWSCVP